MIKVWIDDKDYMNRTVAFRCVVEKIGKNAQLKIAAANLYRIMVNGELAGYGPARAAHGFTRVDSYDLSRYEGSSTVITAEVFSSGINTFYIVDEMPFFSAEISENDRTGCTIQTTLPPILRQTESKRCSASVFRGVLWNRIK